MENREDLRSILPILPLLLRSSSLFWPSPVVEALRALSRGPEHSGVDSGAVLFLAISDMRQSLNLTPSSGELLASSAADGYALFFDDLMSRAEAAKWFKHEIPEMAKLLFRLPSQLETHYQKANNLIDRERGVAVQTGLRLLRSQEPGVVFLTQELIGGLLACSFFCLFPSTNRSATHLQTINFDDLFAILYDEYNEKQENKIKCIIHYFERICSSMPMGVVSFERKVLSLGPRSVCIPYPKASFWSTSSFSLCHVEVYRSGKIEDHNRQALEVDFANKYIGGGALRRGCVQEEIRFMINPELIAGMLFLPSMADNEAIEIIGTERFSNYKGYASSFCFSGDYVDKKDVDSLGRRKTRIVAIDALHSPGKIQYQPNYLRREINKAFCGFLDQSKWMFRDDAAAGALLDQDVKGSVGMPKDTLLHEADLNSIELNVHDTASSSLGSNVKTYHGEPIMSPEQQGTLCVGYKDETGIVTGNWGCGAFGGDPEIKAIIQWLAASQAQRPVISYYTFDSKRLQTLDEVCDWIRSHGWTVGELWNMLVEYAGHRFKEDKFVGFFTWLIPSLSSPDPMILDMPHPP